MSRKTEVRCDRCGDEILADCSCLDVSGGPLRKRLGPLTLDLCTTCTAGLTSWLARPALPTLEPIEEPVEV